MKNYGGCYLEAAELRDLGVAAVGDEVRVHSTCVMVGLDNISFGNHVRVDAYSLLLAGTGYIRLGNYVHIGAHTLVSAGEGVELADFASLSHGVRIFTHSDDFTGKALTNPTVPARFLNVTKGPVSLGRHVVVGAGSVILPGCDIAEGTAVGALSLVGSSLPAWSIYFGSPARRFHSRGRNLLTLERELLAGGE
jgi:galactoside O-acetyltransferase